MTRMRRALSTRKGKVAAGALVLAAAATTFVATRDTGPRVLGVELSTRIVLMNATTDEVIPCGTVVSPGTLSTVRIQGFATSGNGAPQKFRFGYGQPPSQTPESWYDVWQPQATVLGEEVLIAEIAQDLSDVDGLHRFAFGRDVSTQDCNITVTNIPAPSSGETTARPLPLDGDRVDEIRLVLREYGDSNGNGTPNEVVNTCTSGQANTTTIWSGARFKWEVYVRNVGTTQLHTIHTHQETMLPKGNGPNQNTQFPNKRHFEQGRYGLNVPGTGAWTMLTSTAAGGTSGGSGTSHTWHAAEGFPASGGIEVFCSFTKA